MTALYQLSLQLSSRHHVTFLDAAVLLFAFPESTTVSGPAPGFSELQSAASATLPPTVPLHSLRTCFPPIIQSVIPVAQANMVGFDPV